MFGFDKEGGNCSKRRSKMSGWFGRKPGFPSMTVKAVNWCFTASSGASAPQGFMWDWWRISGAMTHTHGLVRVDCRAQLFGLDVEEIWGRFKDKVQDKTLRMEGGVKNMISLFVMRERAGVRQELKAHDGGGVQVRHWRETKKQQRVRVWYGAGVTALAAVAALGTVKGALPLPFKRNRAKFYNFFNFIY